VLEELQTIDASKLSKTDQINLELFRRDYQQAVEGYQYGWYLVPLTARGGIQDQSSTADSLPFEKVKDYEDWIARMRGIPILVDQTIILMEDGIERGILPAKVVMQRVPDQIARQVVDDPERSLFYKPFRDFPAEISEAEKERLRKAATVVIEDSVVPAYQKFQKFFNEQYLPASFDKPGAWQIPDGQEFYAFRARLFTTSDLTPDQIHEIGLKEVARIRKEMEKIVKQVKFEGTFAEFLEYLRTDPMFYCDNPQQLMNEYQAVCERIDPTLSEIFKREPRIPYDIQPIPAHLAPDTTTAYYRQPSANGRRPGTYFVNLYRPEVRPRYEMMALSLHEAVPGHHFQIAFAMELEGLPAFRRYGGYTAFVEGWALYAESLGDELGLYDDPYSKFGQLTYEMWRAVRLVVDTGLHSQKWTRQQAIDFFAANTAKTLHDIENEIDRYIGWPGQALAYKIGELKIKELRQRAESRLGEKFDLKEFHDVVLRHGAVPLDVLEDLVDEWIDETKNS
jgi:prolyl oligopeptidase